MRIILTFANLFATLTAFAQVIIINKEISKMKNSIKVFVIVLVLLVANLSTFAQGGNISSKLGTYNKSTKAWTYVNTTADAQPNIKYNAFSERVIITMNNTSIVYTLIATPCKYTANNVKVRECRYKDKAGRLTTIVFKSYKDYNTLSICHDNNKTQKVVFKYYPLTK